LSSPTSNDPIVSNDPNIDPKIPNIISIDPIVPIDATASNSTIISKVPFTPITETEAGLLTRAFKVTTTKENIIALGDFMNERNINFEKIEL
jgi:calcineurin-like phosphoesterase family protein